MSLSTGCLSHLGMPFQIIVDTVQETVTTLEDTLLPSPRDSTCLRARSKRKPWEENTTAFCTTAESPPREIHTQFLNLKPKPKKDWKPKAPAPEQSDCQFFSQKPIHV